MRWLTWLRRDTGTNENPEPLDLDRILAEGLRDQASAGKAIARLDRERKRLLRQQRAVDKQFRRPSTKDIRNMGRTGPAIGPYQLSQSMQISNTAGQDAEQRVEIDRRLHAISEAIKRLTTQAR